jgi:hypothetical protein
MMKTTVIRKIKRPGGMGRWPAYVLAEDSFGSWLYSPLGCVYRGQSGETITECEVGQGNRARGLPVLHLVPRVGWWFAAWYRIGGAAIIGIDICTPPTRINDEWHYTDLELDPHGLDGGRVELHDEDEFTAACEAGLISATEASEASAAAAELVQCLREKREPFGRVGWDRLDSALGLQLPPITTLSEATA